MNVEVTDSSLVDEVADLLRWMGYSVLRTGNHALRFGADGDGSNLPAAAEVVLASYMRTWVARYPGVQAHVR